MVAVRATGNRSRESTNKATAVPPIMVGVMALLNSQMKINWIHLRKEKKPSASMYNRALGASASSVLLSTVLSVFSVSAWLIFL